MIKVDDLQVKNLFNNLDVERIRKIYNTAIRKAAKSLSDKTKEQLVSAIGNDKATRPSKKYGLQLIKGIKTRIDKDYLEAKVHIMGDYRLKWFEKGTKERVTKKGYKRGKLSGINFFKAAQNNTDIIKIITDSVDQSLNKIKG